MQKSRVRVGRGSRSRAGSILVEALWVLPLFYFVMAFMIELERRAQYEAFNQYVVCRYVRGRRLGVSHRALVRELRSLAFNAMSRREARYLFRGLEMDGANEAMLFARFPALYSFPGKHHFEITKRCYF